MSKPMFVHWRGRLMPFEVLPAGRCVHGLKESDDMINGGMFLFLSLGGRDTHIMKCVCVFKHTISVTGTTKKKRISFLFQ